MKKTSKNQKLVSIKTHVISEHQNYDSNQQHINTINDQESSEKSLSDYTIQSEINILNSNISNTNENGITSMVTSQQNTQRKLEVKESERSFNDFHKKLVSEVEPIAEEKSNLEDTIENKMISKVEIEQEENDISSSSLQEQSQKSLAVNESSLKLPDLISDKSREDLKPKTINQDLMVREIELSPSKPNVQNSENSVRNKEKTSQLLEFLENDELRKSHDYSGAIKDFSQGTVHSVFVEPSFSNIGGGVISTDLKSQAVSHEIELKECYSIIDALKHIRDKQDIAMKNQRIELESEEEQKLKEQKQDYESQIERHFGFINQLISDKKELSQKIDVTKEKIDCDAVMNTREKELKQKLDIELKNNKQEWMAAEKI